jgi:hypothetical protein
MPLLLLPLLLLLLLLLLKLLRSGESFSHLWLSIMARAYPCH